MHIALAREYLAAVRQRISEGDCPVTPALSVETLEELADTWAREAERLSDGLDWLETELSPDAAALAKQEPKP